MSKTEMRRSRLLGELILAAEDAIRTGGLAALKSRELARAIGCAAGQVYNLVDDMDDLVLRVGSRTLAKLDTALHDAAGERARTPADATDQLVRIAIAYCDFAERNYELWRVLFEHRMAQGKAVPDWVLKEQLDLFNYVLEPLFLLFPERARSDLDLLTHSLFSAIHGMVFLGLENRVIGVPFKDLRHQIETIVRAVIAGYGVEAA